MTDTPTSPAPGRHRLLGADGAELEACEATWTVEPDALVVQPRQGPALRVGFSEVDALEPGDHAFALRLAGGEKVEASMLGRRFTEVFQATATALRDYQARNLLLEEPAGGEAFECDVSRGGEEAPAQVRVFATSLAVLPRASVPYGVPFGEVVGVSFDEERYAVDLAVGSEEKISLLRLGKKSQSCLRLLEERLAQLRSRHAAALSYLAPQLGSLAARRLAQAMPDGVPARQGQLDEISPEVWPALVAGATAAEPRLRASSQDLAGRCPPGEACIGLKETNARQDSGQDEAPEEVSPPVPGGEEEEEESATAREDEGAPAQEEEEAAAGEAQAGREGGTPMSGRVVWFAFPVWSESDREAPGNAVAVEAVSRAGRATYLFRIAPTPQAYRELPAAELRELARQRVRAVSRAMVALTFKREPIYLPEEKLRSGPWARYRLAMRLSAPLKAARASFVGRAVHGPGWKKQLEAALARAARG